MRWLLACVTLTTATLPGAAGAQAGAGPDRVQLRLDTAQAAAVLALVASRPRGTEPSPAAWEALFSTEGQRRLRERETGMGRSFTDSAFRAFVLSDGLAGRAGALREALASWAEADLAAAARRALAYLPAEARIRATVYLTIKPQPNSFVWDVTGDPAIFLWLDPAMTAAQFENTVAHELHHVGFASVRGQADAAVADLAGQARVAATWLGALGEGFAMLAAAGGPGVHPHAASPAEDRARWDADVARFDEQLGALDRFFGDVLSGRLATPDTVRAVAMGFFGIQGPWYTVGWRMAVAIEERFGRDELVACMTDLRRLLRRYDEVAVAAGLPRWSPEVLAALAGPRQAPTS